MLREHFSDEDVRERKGAWELLQALAEVTQNQLHEKLEASEFIGLQVDESSDCSDLSNMFLAIQYEVSNNTHDAP